MSLNRLLSGKKDQVGARADQMVYLYDNFLRQLKEWLDEEYQEKGYSANDILIDESKKHFNVIAVPRKNDLIPYDLYMVDL
jgi:hypothetical protein